MNGSYVYGDMDIRHVINISIEYLPTYLTYLFTYLPIAATSDSKFSPANTLLDPRLTDVAFLRIQQFPSYPSPSPSLSVFPSKPFFAWYSCDRYLGSKEEHLDSVVWCMRVE